jgi:hypothetical protein
MDAVDTGKCKECGIDAPFLKKHPLCRKCYNRGYFHKRQLKTPDSLIRARRSPKRLYSQSKSYAKRRELVWSLSFEQFVSLTSEPCHYCYGPLPPYGVGLDRLNSGLGYQIGNVVPCCQVCNTVKGAHWTPEETRVAVAAVSVFRRVTGK